MSPEQFEQFQKQMADAQERNMVAVNEQIKITVNGKIDRITLKIDEYIKDDTAWKEAAQPSIDLGRNVKGTGLVLAGLFGTISVITGALIGIVELIRKVR